MNLKEIVSIPDRDLIRVTLWLFVAVFTIAPGAFLLFLEKSNNLLSVNTLVLVIICLVISIPFNLLGAVTFLHPYKTIKELPKLHKQALPWGILIGSGVWSIISAGACYAFVHSFELWLSINISTDIRVKYCVIYFIMLSLFGSLLLFKEPLNKSCY